MNSNASHIIKYFIEKTVKVSKWSCRWSEGLISFQNEREEELHSWAITFTCLVKNSSVSCMKNLLRSSLSRAIYTSLMYKGKQKGQNRISWNKFEHYPSQYKVLVTILNLTQKIILKAWKCILLWFLSKPLFNIEIIGGTKEVPMHNYLCIWFLKHLLNCRDWHQAWKHVSFKKREHGMQNRFKES